MHIHNYLDIVNARSAVRELAQHLGFQASDQARMATAAAELLRNLLGLGEGDLIIRALEGDSGTGIEFELKYQGVDVSRVEWFLSHGSTNTSDSAQTIPNIKRLMDEFSLQSEVGVGTTIVCRKWRPL
jgi:serine/threonine-protein kinase RsbT